MLYLPNESIDHKLCVLDWNVCDDNLDDMIAILIADAVEDMRFELLDHGSLLMNENVLQSL